MAVVCGVGEIRWTFRFTSLQATLATHYGAAIQPLSQYDISSRVDTSCSAAELIG